MVSDATIQVGNSAESVYPRMQKARPKQQEQGTTAEPPSQTSTEGSNISME